MNFLRRIFLFAGFWWVKNGGKLPARIFFSLYRASAVRELFTRKDVNCVLDVGANRGQYAKYLRCIGYTGPILSFEPNTDCFKVLKERMKTDKSWRGFNIALGNQNETRDFVITKGAMCSSFLTPLRKEIVRSVRRVNMRRLDDFIANLEDFPGNPSLFLKLDTQGFDLEVVNGAPRTLEHTVGLQSEVSVCPIYHDMPHYLDSLKVYESLGFELIGLFEVTKAQGRVIEYDCVMARR